MKNQFGFISPVLRRKIILVAACLVCAALGFGVFFANRMLHADQGEIQQISGQEQETGTELSPPQQEELEPFTEPAPIEQIQPEQPDVTPQAEIQPSPVAEQSEEEQEPSPELPAQSATLQKISDTVQGQVEQGNEDQLAFYFNGVRVWLMMADVNYAQNDPAFEGREIILTGTDGNDKKYQIMLEYRPEGIFGTVVSYLISPQAEAQHLDPQTEGEGIQPIDPAQVPVQDQELEN